MGRLHQGFSLQYYKDGHSLGLPIVILCCVDHASHAIGVLENCWRVNGYWLQLCNQRRREWVFHISISYDCFHYSNSSIHWFDGCDRRLAYKVWALGCSSKQKFHFYDRKFTFLEPYGPNIDQSFPLGSWEARTLDLAIIPSLKATDELHIFHQLFHPAHVPISRFLALGSPSSDC